MPDLVGTSVLDALSVLTSEKGDGVFGCIPLVKCRGIPRVVVSAFHCKGTKISLLEHVWLPSSIQASWSDIYMSEVGPLRLYFDSA